MILFYLILFCANIVYKSYYIQEPHLVGIDLLDLSTILLWVYVENTMMDSTFEHRLLLVKVYNNIVCC